MNFLDLLVYVEKRPLMYLSEKKHENFRKFYNRILFMRRTK